MRRFLAIDPAFVPKAKFLKMSTNDKIFALANALEMFETVGGPAAQVAGNLPEIIGIILEELCEWKEKDGGRDFRGFTIERTVGSAWNFTTWRYEPVQGTLKRRPVVVDLWEYGGHERLYHLYTCTLFPALLINSRWNYEAARLLWRDIDEKLLFKHVKPSRRQLYANHVRKLTLDHGKEYQLLKFLQWPQLRHIGAGVNTKVLSKANTPLSHRMETLDLDIQQTRGRNGIFLSAQLSNCFRAWPCLQNVFLSGRFNLSAENFIALARLPQLRKLKIFRGELEVPDATVFQKQVATPFVALTDFCMSQKRPILNKFRKFFGHLPWIDDLNFEHYYDPEESLMYYSRSLPKLGSRHNLTTEILHAGYKVRKLDESLDEILIWLTDMEMVGKFRIRKGRKYELEYERGRRYYTTNLTGISDWYPWNIYPNLWQWHQQLYYPNLV